MGCDRAAAASTLRPEDGPPVGVNVGRGGSSDRQGAPQARLHSALRWQRTPMMISGSMPHACPRSYVRSCSCSPDGEKGAAPLAAGGAHGAPCIHITRTDSACGYATQSMVGAGAKSPPPSQPVDDRDRNKAFDRPTHTYAQPSPLEITKMSSPAAGAAEAEVDGWSPPVALVPPATMVGGVVPSAVAAGEEEGG